MGRRHDGPHTRLSLWHGRISDTSAQHAFFEQLAREFHCELTVPDDNRRDWRFTGWSCLAANVEAKQAEFFLPEASVFPQPFNALRFVFQHIEGGNARCGNRRWMRRRKQKRPRAVIEKINQVA